MQNRLWYDAESIAEEKILCNSEILSFTYAPETASVHIHLHLSQPVLTNERTLQDDIWLEFENAIYPETTAPVDAEGIIIDATSADQWTLCLHMKHAEATGEHILLLRSDCIYLRKWKYADDYNTVLAESERYLVKRQCEEARLLFKQESRQSVCVGDHYGDVTCAAISPDEKWCVTGGAGLIIYRLSEPFESYNYDRDTLQWIEFGRDSEPTNYITTIQSISDQDVHVRNEDGIDEVFPFPAVLNELR